MAPCKKLLGVSSFVLVLRMAQCKTLLGVSSFCFGLRIAPCNKKCWVLPVLFGITHGSVQKLLGVLNLFGITHGSAEDWFFLIVPFNGWGNQHRTKIMKH